MSSIQVIQTAIADVVTDGTGLHLYDYSALAPIPPALDVKLDQLSYGTTLDDGSEMVFLLRIIVATMATQGSQEQLYDFIDPTGGDSIPAVLAANNTLRGTVSSSYLLPTRSIGQSTIPGVGDYLTALLPLAIYNLD